MADRPIIFSALMIQALLAGRKRQTRRILKSKRPGDLFSEAWDDRYVLDPANRAQRDAETPYAIGDRLWVREGVVVRGKHLRLVGYVADGCEPEPPSEHARTAIYMPRSMSRLTLLVKDVEVQRLQAITLDAACSEGCPPDENYPDVWYAKLWETLHGPKAWDINPWVVAISFTVERKNIDV